MSLRGLAPAERCGRGPRPRPPRARAERRGRRDARSAARPGRGRGHRPADRPRARGGTVPRARAGCAPVPMAPDLTLRHTTVPTPFGPFTVVMSPDGVVATTGGDPGELVDQLARRLGVGSRVAPLRGATRDLAAYFGDRR